mgnify:CR=1 FL=1
MGLADKLKERGFKPEASSDGEWNPYNGTYRCPIRTLRPDRDEKNQADFIQLELDIEEVLVGDMKRESKFPAFRKRYYVDWDTPSDDQADNAQELANVVFTGTGIDLDFSSAEAFKASAEQVIGKEVYIRAWGHTFDKKQDGTPIPDEQRKATQFWVAQKKNVAEKKRSAQSVAF